MSTEFLSEFSYAGDLEKEKTMEELIKFYEQELQIDPDDEKAMADMMELAEDESIDYGEE